MFWPIMLEVFSEAQLSYGPPTARRKLSPLSGRAPERRQRGEPAGDL